MIHPVTVTATTPNVGAWDIADDTLVGARITHGGDDMFTPPDPSTASFTMLDPSGVWRNRFTFATRVEFTVAGATRFVGTVTDLKVTWDGAWVLDVIAVGLKIAARTLIVDPRPAETAAGRIDTAWTAAGLPVYDVDATDTVDVLATTEPGTVSDITNAAAVADLGFISQRRDGAMWYRSRATVAASQLVKAVLPADGVFPASVWVRSIGDLATRVVCGHGTNSPQDYVMATDPVLEAELGRVQERAHSGLYATEADAQMIAAEVLDRMKAPAWRTEALDIDLALAAYDAGRTADVLALEVADVVWVTGAPASTPAGDEETYVVLGWDETLDGTNHELSLRVVEYALLRESARWGNVAMSWATAGATPVGDYRFTPPTLAPGVTP